MWAQSIYVSQFDMNLKTRVQFTQGKLNFGSYFLQYWKWVLCFIFCERYWLKRSLITVVLIIRLALPLFCQINPIQITIIISESKKFPNDTFKQWWNVPKVTHLDVQFPNVKILSIFSSTYQTLALVWSTCSPHQVILCQ